MSTARRKTTTPNRAARKTAPRRVAAKTGAKAPGLGPEEAAAGTQAQLYGAAASLFQRYDRIADFTMATAEALIKAGGAVVRSLEEVGKSWISLSQLSVENGAAAAHAMAGARSLQEILELQSDFGRAILENVLSESLRLSELSTRAADEAIAPLQARLNLAFAPMVKRGSA